MREPQDPPGHGGDLWRAAAESGRGVEEILDFSVNVHPLGPPPGALEAAARAALAEGGRYPPPRGGEVAARISARVGAPVLLGNGATELLGAALAGAARVWVRAPSYRGYAELAWPAPVLPTASDPVDLPFRPGDALVIGRPNNPDGHLPTVDEVASWRRPGLQLVVDESFLGFTDAPSCVGLDGVIVVRSLTKTYAVPGLRLGLAWGLDPRRVPPWTVNAPALAAGEVIAARWGWPREIPLDDWREGLAEALRGRPGVTAVQGAANFLLVRLDAPAGPALARQLLREHGLLVRDASNFAGLDAHHLRVAVRTPSDNARLLEAWTCARSS